MNSPSDESLAEARKIVGDCYGENIEVPGEGEHDPYIVEPIARALDERDARIAELEAQFKNQLQVAVAAHERIEELEALIRSREYITDPKGKAPVFCPWCDSRPHAENCKAKEVLDA